MLTKVEFMEMLKNHDWYYQFSDDHRYWVKGNAEAKLIQAAMDVQPEFKEIYLKYLKDNNLQ